ncbi:MAG: polysaccharide biosynthesis protein [Deltaproteobacteria bacterium]|nr:polysaccharide biosynthesis protein [Deltaproteobacteria bacterium]
MHFALDAAVLLGVFLLAYLLRFEFRVPQYWWERALVQAPVVVLTQLAALRFFGVYAFIWRYVGIHEIGAFFKAVLVATVPLVAVRFIHLGPKEIALVPLSVVVMDTIFAFGGTLGLRVLRRTLYELFEKRNAAAAKRKKRTILIGAGRAGALAAREIVGRADSDLEVVGFVDDDRDKHGSAIQGVKVLGSTADLPHLVREQHIEQVVITIARAARQDFRRIVDTCERIPVKARVIPGLFELLQGNVSVTRIRDVQVEDLLGREPVQLDHELIGRFLTGRVVMVSGAGGSIGSELARQVARVGPKELLLVERAEGPLFEIDRELRAAYPNVPVTPLIADVGDETRIDALFARHTPEVVIHAAAHKHVPMMEQNPGEAIKNNVVGTRTFARTAGRHGAACFVLISTDKAVRPTSVMGASKRVAELVVQDLDRQFERTTFVAVRFGNVLGSAGSVIPIFREQILKGGPVTVTHPDMVRYFMTIPEASQLVLQAGAMGAGGEIFVLDMGEPVKIVDLAKDMIRLSGLKPFEDIAIEFTGMRPGEKLFEELEAHGEGLEKTRHPKIMIGQLQPADSDALEEGVRRLVGAADKGDADEVRALLGAVVPEATLGAQAKASASVATLAPRPAAISA